LLRDFHPKNNHRKQDERNSDTPHYLPRRAVNCAQAK
jgi:hypothetical protein